MAREVGVIRFAERLLALLDEGQFTATYKYAVLLGLIDLCFEKASTKGVAPDLVTTKQLAKKVVELYWQHVLPYGDGDVLRQNTRGQAEILSRVATFRSRMKHEPYASIHSARLADGRGFKRLVKQVELKLIEMPLPRLQRIGAGEDRFIYEIGWREGIPPTVVRRYQRGENSVFDNRILLKPSVGEYLLQLNGLLRPILHRRWARMVAHINALEEDNLERFLFRNERIPTQKLRRGLKVLESGKCFYCRRRLIDGWQVDHFIPIARIPDNSLDNLVPAHRGCNFSKSDYLAATSHLKRWLARPDLALAELSRDVDWVRHSGRSRNVAGSLYRHLPHGTPLWESYRNQESHFDQADPVSIQAVFASSTPGGA